MIIDLNEDEQSDIIAFIESIEEIDKIFKQKDKGEDYDNIMFKACLETIKILIKAFDDKIKYYLILFYSEIENDKNYHKYIKKLISLINVSPQYNID